MKIVLSPWVHAHFRKKCHLVFFSYKSTKDSIPIKKLLLTRSYTQRTSGPLLLCLQQHFGGIGTIVDLNEEQGGMVKVLHPNGNGPRKTFNWLNCNL